MTLELRVVASDIQELGEQLRMMAIGMLGQDIAAADEKGLAGYTDVELLSEIATRGIMVKTVLGVTEKQDAPSDTADKGQKTRTRKPKAEDKPADEPADAPEDATHDPEGVEQTPEPEQTPALSPQEAYDKAFDIAMQLYNGATKQAVMSLLTEFAVKSFRDLDADAHGHAFLQKVEAIQNRQG